MNLDAMIVLQSEGAKELLGFPENDRMNYILGLLQGFSMEDFILDMVDFYELEEEKIEFTLKVIQDILVKKHVFEDDEYLVYMVSLQYVLQNCKTILPMKDKSIEVPIEKILPAKPKKNAELLIILDKKNDLCRVNEKKVKVK